MYKTQYHWQTGMRFIKTIFAITRIQFIWSTFSRYWMLSLLARSSAWNRENRDLGRKWGPFGDPTTKKVPMGTRVPSANVSFFSPHYLPAALHCTMKLWGGVEYLHPKALCDLYHQLPLHFQLHPCLCERLDPWDCSWPWIAGTWGGLRRIKVAISGSAPSSTEARVPTTIYFFLERGWGGYLKIQN